MTFKQASLWSTVTEVSCKLYLLPLLLLQVSFLSKGHHHHDVGDDDDDDVEDDDDVVDDGDDGGGCYDGGDLYWRVVLHAAKER